MSLIIRIGINNKEVRCYSAQRITNINISKPIGTTNQYRVTECYSRRFIGCVNHDYDDSPEKLVLKVMELIGS